VQRPPIPMVPDTSSSSLSSRAIDCIICGALCAGIVQNFKSVVAEHYTQCEPTKRSPLDCLGCTPRDPPCIHLLGSPPPPLGPCVSN
jgi:hypothetical protein